MLVRRLKGSLASVAETRAWQEKFHIPSLWCCPGIRFTSRKRRTLPEALLDFLAACEL
jgi:hypothetical protein